MKEKLSIAVPCYNEEEAIPYFYEEMKQVFAVLEEKHQLDIELLFVDDGSRDGTLKILRKLAQNDTRVKYISFSKNFGKEAGIYAGLSSASGDYVAIMDVDLQDPPMLLYDMIEGIRNEGYDCVATRRVTRDGEAKIRSFFAKLFYKKRGYSAGSGLRRNGLNMRMSRGSWGIQNGLSGNYSYMRWMASWQHWG